MFKFLTVYTKRIEETDALGIYTLDTDSHDQQVVHTIVGQFDGVIEFRESDADGPQLRVRGFGRRPTSSEGLYFWKGCSGLPEAVYEWTRAKGTAVAVDSRSPEHSQSAWPPSTNAS